jgi:signal transduction histidine kinase
MLPDEKVNILLVDDQVSKLLSYEAILSGLNQNIVKASSAREALEHLLNADFAVVLVDVCMPEIDGFELAEMIRGHPRCRKTAIILISAILLTDLDRMRGYDTGAVDYVSVPFVPELLRAKVGVFVDLYRKTTQLEELNQELEERVAERTKDLEASNAMLIEAARLVKEADRRKDQFLAILAHELRNPLAPIRNAVQVLMTRSAPDPELTWNQQVIDRQVRHMARLLDDLLDVSRISHNRLELRKERIALSAVIEAAIETSRALIDSRQHDLAVALPAEPVYLDADPVRLTQVFSNLLNNAANYTNTGGHIRLTGEVKDGDVVVSVADDGIGIAPERLARIFEVFSQERLGPERSTTGLGVGLSLVRGLVDLHGGAVEARSAGPGKGSVFTVQLPVAVEASILEPPAPDVELAVGMRRRVLIVDDLKDSADTLAMLIRMLGHESRTAYDGEEGLAAAEEFRPDVILLDIGMPKLDGYDVCIRIREQPWSTGTCLVALTGWGREDDRRRTLEAGFDQHIVKPVDPAALTRLLAEPRLANRAKEPA